MTERVTIEQNGERFTIEVPDGTSDADIQKFLAQQQGQNTAPETPAEEPKQGPVAPVAESTAGPLGAVAPAVTGAAYGAETGLPQLAKNVGENVARPAMNAAGSYLKNPMNVLTDVALTHMGVPPVAAAKKLYDTYHGVSKAVNGLNDALSQQPQVIKNAFTTLGDKLGTEGQTAFTALYDKNVKAMGDSSKAVQQTIQEFQLPEYLANNAKATQALQELKQGYKPITTMGKVGAVAGPLLRGAGRVLGPAGMAMNLYDAANFAQEADLGGRLARGEGKLAPQAFRSLLNQNVSGYQPTPDEMRNLLASGDQRMIQMYTQAAQAQKAQQEDVQRQRQLKNMRQNVNPNLPNAFTSGFAQQLNNGTK
jgi:hypothetical protein